MDHLPFRLNWHYQSALVLRRREDSKLNRKTHKIRKTWIDVHPCPSFHLAVETVQNPFLQCRKSCHTPSPLRSTQLNYHFAQSIAADISIAAGKVFALSREVKF